MAGAHETPRQKMIGMMYLVLTAMLALNVSREILSAFSIVDSSMVTTIENTNVKLNQSYANLAQIAAQDPNSAGEWYNKAIIAQQETDSLVEYLTDVKARLIKRVDRTNDKLRLEGEDEINDSLARIISVSDLDSKDEYSKATKFFLGNEEAFQKGEADVMIEIFDAYKKKMLRLVKPTDSSRLKLGFVTDKKYKSEHSTDDSDPLVNWKSYFFENTVLSADVVLLNNYIAEARNAEFSVVNILSSYVGATDFKFNDIAAKVIPKKSYVFQGNDYEAEILVAAFDTLSSPDVYYRTGIESFEYQSIATAKRLEGEKGVVNMKLSTAGMSIGTHSFAGVLKMKVPNTNETKDYFFNSTFDIGKPTAIVSADSMNVLYRMGSISNPITVSVPGIPANKVTAQAVGAKLKKVAEGKYEARPTKAAMTTIKVFAEIDGKQTKMGELKFRNKNTPDPTILLRGFKPEEMNAPIPSDWIANAGGLDAVLLDFLFSGVSYKVSSFRVYGTRGGFGASEDNQGALFNENVKKLIKSTRDKLTIAQIFVIPPEGGEPQQLQGSQGSLVIEIQ